METDNKHVIVGIGASAGGVEALQQFFSSVPSLSGMSFVVVQHLSPDYKSLMADILHKYTDMPIYEAEDNMKVEPDTIYLNPPKMYLTFKDGALHLNPLEQGTISHPIDKFFSALAEEKRDKAIGIILSGTGTDGSAGSRDIKEHGGIVIAQSPESAKFDGMPHNIINLGIADYIMAPEEIGEELRSLPDALSVLPSIQSEGEDGGDDELLIHIYAILKNECGIDFTYYKRSTILRRIERRMGVKHCQSLAEYIPIPCWQ